MSKILTKKSNYFGFLIFFFSFKSYTSATPLILISIDGYRYDYTKIYSPPALSQIEQFGFSATSLIPVFPSKTFPNHYSIITGLYAGNHGLISNSFKDNRRKNETYRIDNKKTISDSFWYHGEPFWNVVKKNGFKTASYFWVGSETYINNHRPDYVETYNNKIPTEQRVDQVIDWLELPKNERPIFITLYFSQVDRAGHKFGPNSVNLKNAIFNVDDAINRLMIKLKQKDIEANILIVSDHGMRELSNKSYIKIPEEILKNKNIVLIGQGSLMLIYHKKGKGQEQTLSLLKKIKNIKVFKKMEIPKRYNYLHEHRTPDILVTTKPGFYLSKKLPNLKPKQKRGTHGYDPIDTKMHGILYGKGPNIKNIKTGRINNVDIFSLMGKLLNLKKMPVTDGSIESLKVVYKENLTSTGK